MAAMTGISDKPLADLERLFYKMGVEGTLPSTPTPAEDIDIGGVPLPAVVSGVLSRITALEDGLLALTARVEALEAP